MTRLPGAVALAAPDGVRRALVAALLVAIAGRARAIAPLSGRDVTDLRIKGLLGLRDEHGRVRRLAEFRGKAILLFFGYTGCPDVCPTTLLRMAEVVRELGADAARVQVLWITVDPEHDTQALVGRYVHAFNPGFIGLRGTPAQTQAVAQAFRIHYQVATYKGEALVSHSAFGYLIDGRGRVRVRVDYEAAPDRIAADVRAVLEAS